MSPQSGWRWWRVSPDGVLTSPIDRITWLTAVFTAGCLVDSGHAVPAAGCTCGVYAFTSEADVHSHVRATTLVCGLGLAPELRGMAAWPIVLGVVDLTEGAVAKRPPESSCVELRAASARITRLYLDDDQDLAATLAARYGVPIT